MMITTPSGQHISTFRDLWALTPADLRSRLYGLWKVPQRPDYHPEGNTFKHVITVVERAIRSGDPDIVAAALFHDIGKDVTLKFTDQGHPTAHGHEEESSKLVKEHRKFIRDIGGNPVVVYFIVKQHMRVKNIDDMRKRKQKFLRDNPNFGKLDHFRSIDRGGLKVEQVIREYSAGDAMMIPDEIRKMAHEFKNHGHNLYVVGGAVRDFLLDKSPKDYDLATDAIPDKSLEIIRSMGYKSLEVGKSFGVVVAIPPSGNEYEIATFREDVGAGRRPDAVKFSDIGTDVKRRDLTVNALFYDIDANKVVDLVGGINDLESGTIRTVGNPMDRFGEDPLRKLRALRFYAKIGKKIDPATLQALQDTNLEGVSSERIRDEFMKSISAAQSPKKYLILADKLGYLPIILGNMQYSRDFSDNSDPEVQLATLLTPENPENIKNRLLDMRYSRDEIRNIVTMVEMTNVAKNKTFDKIYPLSRAYGLIDKRKAQIFAKEVGISRFVEALSKVDIKNVDVVGLSKVYKKEALGRAIQDALKTQFLQIYAP